MVTGDPTGPEGTDRLSITGCSTKLLLLLAVPFTVMNTLTLPAVGPRGTLTVTAVLLQPLLTGVPGTLVVPSLKVTTLLPCVDPKLAPLMVKAVPGGMYAGTGPPFTVKPLMLGDVSVKFTPLLGTPATASTTLPENAPSGTGAVIVPLAFQV